MWTAAHVTAASQVGGCAGYRCLIAATHHLLPTQSAPAVCMAQSGIYADTSAAAPAAAAAAAAAAAVSPA
jgi:hypothetical protein